MTIQEAKKIMEIWGEHLEFRHAKLMTLFFVGSIPESFLPYPNEVLWEAINIMGKFYFDMGDYETSEFLKSTLDPTAFYVEDEKAIDHFIELLNMQGLEAKNIILSKLKEQRHKPWSPTPDTQRPVGET
jgi:hypothetical protein